MMRSESAWGNGSAGAPSFARTIVFAELSRADVPLMDTAARTQRWCVRGFGRARASTRHLSPALVGERS